MQQVTGSHESPITTLPQSHRVEEGLWVTMVSLASTSMYHHEACLRTFLSHLPTYKATLYSQMGGISWLVFIVRTSEPPLYGMANGVL